VDVVIAGASEKVRADDTEVELQNNRVVVKKGAGWLFGDLTLLFSSPRTASVVASTRVTAWGMDRRTFLQARRPPLADCAAMRSSATALAPPLCVRRLHRFVCSAHARASRAPAHPPCTQFVRTHAANARALRFVRKLPLMQGVPDSVLVGFAERLREQSYADGQHLIREGDSADALFLIRSGSVRVVAHGQSLATLGRGNVGLPNESWSSDHLALMAEFQHAG